MSIQQRAMLQGSTVQDRSHAYSGTDDGCSACWACAWGRASEQVATGMSTTSRRCPSDTSGCCHGAPHLAPTSSVVEGKQWSGGRTPDSGTAQ
eukprot:5075824-Alexandrium_andersonii.AAC.1